MSGVSCRTETMSRTKLIGAAVALVVVVTACGSGGGDAESTTTPAPAPLTSSPATTAPPPSTVLTVESATAPVSGATTQPATPETTPPPPAATAPPTVAATTTTEPLAAQELVLSGEGIGSALFGAEPEGIIQYVSSILGGPTEDTGWVAPDAFALWEGTRARRVDWGTLSLLFTDLSPIADGRRHFIGYEYGRVGEIGDEPVGLRTPGGITLGSRVVDLLAEFPDAAVNEGDSQVGIPDNFYVSNVFYGLLTGTTADDYVTVLFGGYGCGE